MLLGKILRGLLHHGDQLARVVGLIGHFGRVRMCEIRLRAAGDPCEEARGFPDLERIPPDMWHFEDRWQAVASAAENPETRQGRLLKLADGALTVSVFPSSINALKIPAAAKEGDSGLAQRLKANLAATPLPELASMVFEARLADLGYTPDVNERCWRLYLYSLKPLLLPGHASDRMARVRSEHVDGFLFGAFPKSDLVTAELRALLPDGLYRREVAAYELSEALGWRLVPETILRDDAPFGMGSLQRFVDADRPAEIESDVALSMVRRDRSAQIDRPAAQRREVGLRGEDERRAAHLHQVVVDQLLHLIEPGNDVAARQDHVDAAVADRHHVVRSAHGWPLRDGTI